MIDQLEMEWPTISDVCGLVATDPTNQPTVDAFVVALRQAVAAHGLILTANQVRPFLPSWVNQRVVSAQYNVLKAKGVLTSVDAPPERNRDAKGRNGNKTLPRYAVDLSRLGDVS